MPRVVKQRHCFNCGADIGIYADYERTDTCGKQECEREVRDMLRQERDEAHEHLDRDNGWDRF